VAALEVSVDDALHELTIDATALPEAARRADAVVQIELEEGDIVEVEYLLEETERREERAQSRFDRLSRRPPNGDSVDGPDDRN
jgi:hypothetical protein